MKKIALIMVISSSIMLTGCLFGQHGTIHNRSNDYLNTQSDPALKLPNGTQLKDNQPAFPIPSQPTSKRLPSLVPPGNPDLIDPDAPKQES